MSGLSGTSIGYLKDLYRRYEDDPSSVDYSWRCVFDLARELSESDGWPVAGKNDGAALATMLAELVRQRGHLQAKLDPLGRDTVISATPEIHLRQKPGTVEGAERLAELYGSSITIETAHIDDPVLRNWVTDAFEALPQRVADEDARRALERLIEADEFEAFMSRKHPTKKRFGAEGGEAFVALVDRLLFAASRSGVDEVVVAGMHRGRLNLMANVFGKPLVQLFAELDGVHPFLADPPCVGDVPYHLGFDGQLEVGTRKLRVTVAPHPSHLEAIDPVVIGRVRARQDASPNDRSPILGLILHTDASIVGQGVVGECLQFSGVPGFYTFGTIHVIVNNQIGFTTKPWEGRTSRYCTGPWKAIDAPIIHVNGDDPDACLRATDFAVTFRQTHGRDVVIDLVCYRRNGHNELDEPRFTQPLAYDAIDGHVPVRSSFEDELVTRGALSRHQIDEAADRYRQRLEEAFTGADQWRPNISGFPNGRWADFRPGLEPAAEPETGIGEDRLKALLDRFVTPPPDMRLNSKVEKLIRQRRDAEGRGASWSIAEGLAFASLLTEGVPVRLSGQDAIRGTFSSQHFGVVDIKTGRRLSTLEEIVPRQAPFTILNSPLSEYAVLGFEYGYSLESPDALVVWEAQFGDFANGAQIIIDQFIAAGEEKWLQPSGLVMLVPHGLDGQGPSIPLRVPNDICSSRLGTIFRSPIHRHRRTTSTSFGVRFSVAFASR